jgi:CheY-specific phosphatase CheX
MLRAEHVDAFLVSAFRVLGRQAQAGPMRGCPVLRKGLTNSSRELTALVVLGGPEGAPDDLAGLFMFGMSLATAVKLGAILWPSEGTDTNLLVHDVVLQTAQLIATEAVAMLEEQGFGCALAESLVVYGFGERLTVISPVLIVPLFTQYGDMDIGLAIQPRDMLPANVPLISARSAASRPPEAEAKPGPGGRLASSDEASAA